MIVELRQYTLRPGRRDELIELFDREFVESQEQLGMAVLGQFRDLDRPDRFVWLRGFTDMAARRRGLAAFYGGPVWRRHGPAANDTMIEFDDVLLLRTVVAPPQQPRDGGPAGSELRATVRHYDRPTAAGPAAGLAVLVTEYAVNDFPALPVREGEHVVVSFSRAGDPVPPGPAGAVRTGHLRLAPTARSALR